MNIQIRSNEVREVMTVAREKHWGFRVLKNEPMISSPVYDNGWWFLPINDNKSIIPIKAIQRVEKLKELDFKIQGVIVAHEAPKLLCQPKVQPVEIPTKEINQGTGELGSILLSLIGLFFYIAVSAIMIDPALIVVLKDGSWVEVYRWVESSPG